MDGKAQKTTFMASLREARAELELRAPDGIVRRGNERFYFFNGLLALTCPLGSNI